METTVKEAKDYLLQVERLDAKIESVEAYIDNLNDSLFRITQTYKQDVVTGGSSHDRMASTIVKIGDLKTEHGLLWDKLIAKREQIMRQLYKVRHTGYLKVLQMRYVDLEKWEDIADEMHYSVRNVHKLHGRALQVFAKIIDEEKKENSNGKQ